MLGHMLSSIDSIYPYSWGVDAQRSSTLMLNYFESFCMQLVRLFKDTILLCDGYVLYQGPTGGVDTYLTSLGLWRPPHLDIADWAAEVLANPATAAAGSEKERGRLQDDLREAEALQDDLREAEALQDEAAARSLRAALQAAEAAPLPDLAFMTPAGLAQRWEERQRGGGGGSEAVTSDHVGGVTVAATHAVKDNGLQGPTKAVRDRAATETAAAVTTVTGVGGSQRVMAPMATATTTQSEQFASVVVDSEATSVNQQPLLQTPYARLQYGHNPVQGRSNQAALAFCRQFQLNGRNWLYTILRLVNCSVMGGEWVTFQRRNWHLHHRFVLPLHLPLDLL